MRWATTRSSIIARLRDPRDDAAWRAFDRLYGEVLVRYAACRGLALDEAEDVRQNVLVSLLTVMPRFDLRRDRGRFRSYLGRVVGNAIHRYRARAHVRRELVVAELEAFDPGAVDREADERWEREWSEHHLRRALAALAPTVRPGTLAIFSRLLDGVRPEGVAAEHGVSVAAVYKVQERMRARLGARVRAQVEAESCALAQLGEPGGSAS